MKGMEIVYSKKDRDREEEEHPGKQDSKQDPKKIKKQKTITKPIPN
jgi:hypothetical protein